MGNASNHVKGGYIGRLLYADLSKAALRTVNLEPPFMLRYVGGRGWGARIIWDEIPPRADPLGPRNKLCVITGPLTGTLAVASGKTSFSAISPATGYYGDSNMGGVFGVRLKQAGFDGLVIEGRATSPVYLWVRDGEAEIRDAGDYWGKGSLEAETIIRRDLGDARASVVSIGPAGENLVKFACITGDYGRQAARCGLGAVMGSKGLKAIAVSGSQDIPVADIGGLWQVFKEVMRFISESVDTDFWRRQGTWQFFEWSNGNECLPTRNFSETICRPFSRMGDVLAGGSKAADTTCFLCPIGCGNLCRVRTGGRAVATIGPEYESAAMLGPNCGIESFTDVAYAAYLCDELGLDAVSAGAVAAFAMECRERGILTDKDLGVDLRFGNGDALFRFLEMLARRDGIGNLFAEGVKGASKVIGRGSERFAMHV
ncbi:TPA: aldehyde ferredoxin oxidoreductase, partial [Candidatus Bathyarchaeota archaeon]|nr:aldehyde ferredoxin oxidoreductase [Candidatus Bathyarchaeota archaeon]